MQLTSSLHDSLMPNLTILTRSQLMQMLNSMCNSTPDSSSCAQHLISSLGKLQKSTLQMHFFSSAARKEVDITTVSASDGRVIT